MEESTSNAKKKADELVYEFWKAGIDASHVKQCALICVDEQIKLLLRLEQLGLITLAEYNLLKEQFNEVKSEISNL